MTKKDVEIKRLRGLLEEFRDYASQHESWRCAHYGKCMCGLDELYDRCGWTRVPCVPETNQAGGKCE